MSKKFLASVGGLAVLLMAGCAAKPEAEAASSAASGANASQPGDTRPASGGRVYNAPPQNAAPGEGYRIAPANPNDPKFKQDPRLGGGG